MSQLDVTPAFRIAHPTAVIGLLTMNGVSNPERHPALDVRKDELERELRARFDGADPAAIRASDPFAAYVAYYKRYKKTYHVAQQFASVVLGGKAIPTQAALVEAMFMAELGNGLLTAGHDLDVLEPPLRVDAATGAEFYASLGGGEVVCKPGDMVMSDAQGAFCSVIMGPDARTRIRPTTRNVLFVVYGVPGVSEDAILRHLGDIDAYVRIVAPAASVCDLSVVGVDAGKEAS